MADKIHDRRHSGTAYPQKGMVCYGIIMRPPNFLGAEANNTQYEYGSESGKMVDYYFFYGPDFDHIISSVPHRYRRSADVSAMDIRPFPIAGQL